MVNEVGETPGQEKINMAPACCKIEAVVGVDERGQILLPKEIRDRAGIGPGDKLAVVGFEDQGALCCISLFKVEDLTDMVKTRMQPLMMNLFNT